MGIWDRLKNYLADVEEGYKVLGQLDNPVENYLNTAGDIASNYARNSFPLLYPSEMSDIAQMEPYQRQGKIAESAVNSYMPPLMQANIKANVPALSGIKSENLPTPISQITADDIGNAIAWGNKKIEEINQTIPNKRKLLKPITDIRFEPNQWGGNWGYIDFGGKEAYGQITDAEHQMNPFAIAASSIQKELADKYPSKFNIWDLLERQASASPDYIKKYRPNK